MTTLFDVSGIQARIFTLPNRPPFLIAADLAEVYGTTVSALNQAVSRNLERFPEDFMFTFTEGEMEDLKSQNVISTKANRALPVGFTHAGALMLSAVLKTPTAAQVSVIIHRAFAAIEQATLSEVRYLLVKLRTEETIRKRIRFMVCEGVRDGLTFEGIWQLGNYSKPKVAAALRECLAMGLIDRLPTGMPLMQGNLFDV
jgi:ORF6N domain